MSRMRTLWYQHRNCYFYLRYSQTIATTLLNWSNQSNQHSSKAKAVKRNKMFKLPELCGCHSSEIFAQLSEAEEKKKKIIAVTFKKWKNEFYTLYVTVRKSTMISRASEAGIAYDLYRLVLLFYIFVFFPAVCIVYSLPFSPLAGEQPIKQKTKWSVKYSKDFRPQTLTCICS